MKQQAYAKLLEQMEEQWANMPITDDVVFSKEWSNMGNLMAKSYILRKGGNACASVVRELMNS